MRDKVAHMEYAMIQLLGRRRFSRIEGNAPKYPQGDDEVASGR